ncbi:uncharacterized protein FIBRA_04298 [Fibroporia radiculosa]|uniref:Cytochrome P450 n=1 Tax=Fibroporia radiculosa TaxID=599839 RepID=J4G757_9APHY|nr:uncharacterized protein FIBRA_04298 [Fibroporia radiculosa]CCM02218.1 predicted protein [Fibroporia radiculosa]
MSADWNLEVVASLVLLAILVSYLTGSVNPRLPPGPKPLPLLGNLHQLPSQHQYKVFTQWARQYGDVFFVKIFHKPVLVVNDAKAARELMEKRSSKYSDRPRTVVLSELVGMSPILFLLPYGNDWRRHRKWFQNAFQVQSARQNFRPLQQSMVQGLLLGLVESPHDFRAHVKRALGTAMLEIAYGHVGTDEEYVKLADMATSEALELGGAGTTLVDFFPILKFTPAWMSSFKRRTIEIEHLVRAAWDVPYDRVMKEIAAGHARKSFLSSLIMEASADGNPTKIDERHLKGAGIMVYGGECEPSGTDTTVTALMTFILAMTLHPDVCKKAQAEIDQAVGPSRLVDFDDRTSLPYFECVIKEVYRWAPPLPLGKSIEYFSTGYYHGFHIPAGSTIVPNIWAMTRNTDVYPEPDRFWPERFEHLDAKTMDEHDPAKLIFGFGRRICPGRNLGDSSVWLAAANMLSTLDIRKARTVAGEEITPEVNFADGVISHVAPFQCDIVPRSEKAKETIALYNPDVIM